MKTKTLSLILALFTIFAAFSVFPVTVTANAENNSWETTLKNFLINDFPSLFDEATKKKNEELLNKWNENWQLNNWHTNDFVPNPADMPVDSFNGWQAENHYYPMLLPYSYNFYDLDSDGIPEVVITYPTWVAEGHIDYVYKLNGTHYEKIYSTSVDFYTNAQNKLVLVEGFYTTFYAVYFAEIKNGEFVFSDYIDSTGSDTFKGFKYNNLGGDEYTGVGDLDKEFNEELATLTPLAQFDCDDIIASMKNMTASPKTGDSNAAALILLGFTSVIIIFEIKKNRGKIK